MTEANSENKVILKKLLCIHYLLRFSKDIAEVKALLNFGNETNAIMPAYATKINLKVRLINIGAQKIDGFILNTFRMVLTNFQMKDKLSEAQYFQETFLFADINLDVVLKMLFLALSNADVSFSE